MEFTVLNQTLEKKLSNEETGRHDTASIVASLTSNVLGQNQIYISLLHVLVYS